MDWVTKSLGRLFDRQPNTFTATQAAGPERQNRALSMVSRRKPRPDFAGRQVYATSIYALPCGCA
jgi:hypothetical protein